MSFNRLHVGGVDFYLHGMHLHTKNCVESEDIITLGSEWFDHVKTDMIKETLTRQDLFENPKYIISKEGIQTDSSWRAVPENEITEAVAFVEKLIAEKKWEEWFEVVLADIEKYGQSNNVVLIKK